MSVPVLERRTVVCTPPPIRKPSRISSLATSWGKWLSPCDLEVKSSIQRTYCAHAGLAQLGSVRDKNPFHPDERDCRESDGAGKGRRSRRSVIRERSSPTQDVEFTNRRRGNGPGFMAAASTTAKLSKIRGCAMTKVTGVLDETHSHVSNNVTGGVHATAKKTKAPGCPNRRATWGRYVYCWAVLKL